MNLESRLKREFDAGLRDRGRTYYWNRQVRIRNGSPTQVEARVAGTRNYDVAMTWKNGVLQVSCDCPYFESDGPCKHIWTAILAADEKGYLKDAVNAQTLVLDDGTLTDLDDGDDDEDQGEALDAVLSPQPQSAWQSPPKPPSWKSRLNAVAEQVTSPGRTSESWPSVREVLYVVEAPPSQSAGRVILSFWWRAPKAAGGWTRPSALSLRLGQVQHLPLDDREIFSLIEGGKQYYGWGTGDSYESMPASVVVKHPLSATLIPKILRTGRCSLRLERGSEEVTPLTWDDGGEWRFKLEMGRNGTTGWRLGGFLWRNEERMQLEAAQLITKGGLVFSAGKVAPLAADTEFEWMMQLRQSGAIEAHDSEAPDLLEALLLTPGLPAFETPTELSFEQISIDPKPALKIGGNSIGRTGKLRAALSFDYGGRHVAAHDPKPGFHDGAARQFIRRDPAAENSAADYLNVLGLKFFPPDYYHREPGWELPPAKLPRIARDLLAAGWRVEADGKTFRSPGAVRVEVSSGVDWFELNGEVSYGETSTKLPELLAAMRRGEKMIRLGDGSFGMLPEEWMERFGALAGLGTVQTGSLRFRRSQAGLLDAMLAAQPEARFDEGFAHVREELRSFSGVAAAPQPDGFRGKMRDYQREGLGWMQFLRRFSFGGCLADDMGVGKTAQVLALLETRRELRAAGEPIPPALVVAPRSLVFNWKEEAARFTPNLRVLDYTGAGRDHSGFADCDVIVTTYGTVRSDILHLRDFEFDYVILDEAQAVKNSNTEGSKAVRLLNGVNRLALSGTPVENHLGELWSLFEFLNPGMLGAASVFKLSGSPLRAPSDETRTMLALALRPFILRRTKEQVARELPLKTEQTIYCELKPAQRKLYDGLRQHYRESLLTRIDKEGMGKSKIHVLEALLRLRQAACHPGLVDKDRVGESSAKLETIMEQLREVIDGGHKALVFSQFTSLLAILRDRLDHAGIIYEYLDGQTRDRQACVNRFQNDPDCMLFLVSLKAGGLGLNLTAAEYVFLLDPWWNPAVEAQAVDRAHRIGQTRQVFAYRLIARDTVEEKVLELQKSKRDLAAAIINADNSVIGKLKREDLELLLS